MILRETSDVPRADLVALYNAVGWVAYTRDPDALARATAASTYVVSLWDDDALVALARCLSDDVAICYVQDILVHPDYQRQGLGRRLMRHCLERFAHVRMTVLLTDDSEQQLRFYTALGFTNTRDLPFALNTFVRMRPPENAE